jgi:hypothetical protein
MEMIDQLFDAFGEAKREAQLSLEREGLSPHEAEDEAADYVSAPLLRPALTDDARAEFRSRIALEQLADEFIEIVSMVDLSTVRVWDLDFVVPRTLRDQRYPYLSAVAAQTELYRSEFGVSGGIAIGGMKDGDVIWCRSGAPDRRCVLSILDHETGTLSSPIAGSLMGLMIVSARTAAAYYKRLGAVAERGWEEAVASEAGATERDVSREWILSTVRARPRPR